MRQGCHEAHHGFTSVGGDILGVKELGLVSHVGKQVVLVHNIPLQQALLHAHLAASHIMLQEKVSVILES